MNQAALEELFGTPRRTVVAAEIAVQQAQIVVDEATIALNAFIGSTDSIAHLQLRLALADAEKIRERAEKEFERAQKELLQAQLEASECIFPLFLKPTNCLLCRTCSSASCCRETKKKWHCVCCS
jgi:predicted metal-binding protein